MSDSVSETTSNLEQPKNTPSRPAAAASTSSKIGYLTGEKKEPVADDATYPTWDTENSMVMTWLGELYGGGHKLQLLVLSHGKGALGQRQSNDLDLCNHYEWKSPEDCNHYKKTVEDNCIFKFLIGLNVEFDEVRGRIIGRQPLPSIGEVFSEVCREESRRLVMLGKKNFGSNVENSALAAGMNSGRNTTKKTDERRIWCDHCNKPRHTRETYWKIHGKPANWKGSHEGRFTRNATAHEAESVPFNKV
ncbi:uncharacterized protein LOC112093095 [Morus notabilis]|uniref:uncharacterized protein LOC112093095 n=1 Tax=Morus notabilis TaxID=981085 RepID=UPI000CED42C1|nr:uncharacterized protein LOC112093095 [Morus notabilis]